MKIFGAHDPQTIAQFTDVASRAAKAALMADGHVGYVMPIGGVAAYHDQVSVVGVGFDIACGNAAIRTDMHIDDLGQPDEKRHFMLERIADDLQRTVSFGIGRTNAADDAPVDDPLFEAEDWFRLRERAGEAGARKLKERARGQLGTVGSGNHYVDLFADEAGMLWVGVHFGSRGFGHGVASGFLAVSQGRTWGDRVPEAEALLSLHATAGQDYWALMNLAGRYAYAGREWVARKVVSLLGARELELVHNHHNFAWKEMHDGEELVVVRKGATPAFPGQKGFIGGSMGDDAVIVRGVDAERTADPVATVQREALFSTIHGAGRVMSRTEAAGKRKGWGAKARIVRPGKVSPEMMREWVAAKGVILRGGGTDESPHVYRRLPEVLAAQEGTVEVLHTLRPLIVVMAGGNEFDPYKD
ncbi:MAG: RtcB family protein [Gemmatimonadota bacterium]|nr:RtcB family protein [Gemmatimonadota bacterium]